MTQPPEVPEAPAASEAGSDKRGPWRADVALALFYALVSAALGWLGTQFVRTDLAILLRAVEIFRDGGDPYRAMVGSAGLYFYYPLPTAVVLIPLTYVPLPVAGALLMGISGGLLAYGLLRDGRIAFFVLASAPMLFACRLGQLSPLVTAAVLVPGIGLVFSLKPNLGVACLSGWTRPLPIAGGIGVALASLLIIPEWPWLWWESLQNMPLHPAPVTIPGGVLALLALLRWRRPEARLLCVLACLPQVMLFADQLPLMLVPRTRHEQAALWILGWIGVAGAYWALDPDELLMDVAGSFVVWTIYLPALLVLLRRPNEGRVPAWLERVLARMPAWFRGRAAPA